MPIDHFDEDLKTITDNTKRWGPNREDKTESVQRVLSIIEEQIEVHKKREAKLKEIEKAKTEKWAENIFYPGIVFM